MKTLLEVIKLNKSNIDKIGIGEDLSNCEIGDKVKIHNKKCICLGPDKTKNNMFAIIPDPEEYIPGIGYAGDEDKDFPNYKSLYFDNNIPDEDGKTIKEYILNKYKDDLKPSSKNDPTIWMFLDKDEYYPSIDELTCIINNVREKNLDNEIFNDIFDMKSYYYVGSATPAESQSYKVFIVITSGNNIKYYESDLLRSKSSLMIKLIDY